jgi:hypothetical protein
MACLNCKKNNEKRVRNFETIGVRRSFDEPLNEGESRSADTESQTATENETDTNPKAQYWAILDAKGIKYKKTFGIDALIQLVNESNEA